MQHRDKIVINKILDEIDVAQGMLGDTTLEVFLENEMLKRAIAMTAINVGELIKNVTEELRHKYHNIPWKAAAGMRDMAAHKYQTLRMEDVYQTATEDFPSLKEMLEDVLAEEETMESCTDILN